MGSRWVGLIVTAVAAAFFIVSFVTPWYYYTLDTSLGDFTTNCWIEGSCRGEGDDEGNSVKVGDDLKTIYEVSFALMIVGIVLVGLLIFLLLWKNFKKKQPGGPNARMGLAALAALVALAAVLCFSIGVPKESDLDGFWTSREVLGQKSITGPSAGWYFAVATVPTLAIAAYFVR